MVKNCLKCNGLFFKKPSHSRKAWATTIYCSHSCANSVNSKGNRYAAGKVPWNRGRKSEIRQNLLELVCEACMGTFKVKYYRKETARFCSVACRTKILDHGKTPENERARKSVAYKSWRNLIFERDNYTCVWCRTRGGHLQADHIKPFALFPNLRLEVSNGRTMCVPCHKRTGTWGRVGIFRNLSVAVATEA